MSTTNPTPNPTKSDLIRRASQGRKATEIVRHLGEQGVKVTLNLVKQVQFTERQKQRKQLAKKAADHKATLAAKALNRSEEIRQLLRQEMSPDQIVLSLGDRGIQVSLKLVKVVAYQAKNPRRQKPPIPSTATDHLVVAHSENRLTNAATHLLARADPSHQVATLDMGSDRIGVVEASKNLRTLRRDEILRNSKYEPPQPDANFRIYHARFQDLMIESESAGLVLTDPPWGVGFLDQLDDLGSFVHRVLKPHGVFVCYAGKSRLDKTLQLLGRHLEYRWCCASTWTGPGNHLHGLNVLSHSTVILVFSKGKFQPQTLWRDTYHSPSQEKDWHDWQRPLDEITRLVKAFSSEGELVVDPCGGGFTTAAACFDTSRPCISCDVDLDAVILGQERLRRLNADLGHVLVDEPRPETNELTTTKSEQGD